MFVWIIGIFLCLLLFGSIFLYCIKPNTQRRQLLSVFEKQYIAHRGLFDHKHGIPENSIPAFQKAVKYGYGIELDVQLTADYRLVVFHDASLNRMCHVNRNIWQCSFSELQECFLNGSKEKIPLFEDVLKMINGKVPLIVEVKPEGNWKETTRRVAEKLDHYPGWYCVESFHPLVVEWFKKNRPNVIRGQLSTDYFKDHISRKWYEKFALTYLLLNFKGRPDFIAYNHKWSGNWAYTLCRTLFDVENVAWTIRNQKELEKAKKVFQVLIFDSFIPDQDER